MDTLGGANNAITDGAEEQSKGIVPIEEKEEDMNEEEVGEIVTPERTVYRHVNISL